MKEHPLFQHYTSQIETLRSAELALTRFIRWLHRRVPGHGLGAALADIETSSLGRLDCLQSLAHRHGFAIQTKPSPTTELFLRTRKLEIALVDRAALRHAIAIRICADLIRQLINDYRVMRGMAGKLRFYRDGDRLDTLMGNLADRNVCWSPGSAPGTETQDLLDVVSG